MNAAYATDSRVKLDARQVDRLIRYGMDQFDSAGIYVSPSKMSKIVRDAARNFGFALAERIVQEYFEAAERLQWESYLRALKRGSL